MSTELLPCPFCGAVPRIGLRMWKGETKYHYLEFALDHGSCPASAAENVSDPSRDRLIAAWNRRASRAEMAEDAELLSRIRRAHVDFGIDRDGGIELARLPIPLVDALMARLNGASK